MKKFILLVAVVILLPVSCPVSAITKVYTDEAAFVAALKGTAYLLEDFSGYTFNGFVGPSLPLGPQNGYSCTLTATGPGSNNLFSLNGGMSTQEWNDSIVATFTGLSTYAVGGWFFADDAFGNYIPGNMILTLSDGTVETYDPPDHTTFRGFISSMPLTSLSIDANNFSALDHFYVGGPSQADVSVTKTDSSDAYTPGARITYTIVARNEGPAAVTGATVRDILPATLSGATWTALYSRSAAGPASGAGDINAAVNLPVGGTATFMLTAAVDSTATGNLVNTVTVAPPVGTSDPTPNNTATDLDLPNPQADLSVTKTDGSDTYAPGAQITYTIVARNGGPSAVTGATVRDMLPATLSGATWTALYSLGAAGPASGTGNIDATVNLPVGGTATFTLTGTVDLNATGNLVNTVTVAPPAGTSDPTPNNTATDFDLPNPQADLSVTKTDGSDAYTPGARITYTIVARNGGPGMVAGATVRDMLPATLSGATWTVVYSPGAVGPASGTGDINATVNLPVGGAATFTLTGTVDATATGDLINTVTVAPPTGVSDPNPTNNKATDLDLPNPKADISVIKTDYSNIYTPGTPIIYIIGVSNGGPSAVMGATVRDMLPATLSGATWTVVYSSGAAGPASGAGDINAAVNLPVGGTATFMLTGTVAATATGNLINTATVAPPAGTSDPTPGNNTATDLDSPNLQADLSVINTDYSDIYTPGASIIYIIGVSNDGPSVVTGATVRDILPATLSNASWKVLYSPGAAEPASGMGDINAKVDLPVGRTAFFTLTGTVTPSATGKLINMVTVVTPTDVLDPNPGNNTATDTDVQVDFGDLADPPYPTLRANNGTRHIIDDVTYLGVRVDSESDGQPNADSTGDDQNIEANARRGSNADAMDDDLKANDEDGVVFTSPLVAAETATLTVTAHAPGVLNAWVDFNGSGAFDTGEQVFTDMKLQQAGDHELNFKVPANAAVHMASLRFRFTALADQGGGSPTGLALTGEVEDYQQPIYEKWTKFDFGDLADPPYRTLLGDNGARHILAGQTYLGASVDAETNGQPRPDAWGDGTDEDGVVFTSLLVPGGTADVAVNTSTGGVFNAWMDFNGDGVLAADERIFTDVTLNVGANRLLITVPRTAVAGKVGMRFRLTAKKGEGGDKPTGLASTGEVEDYVVTIQQAPANGIDFGDLGGLGYLTQLTSNGAHHIIDGVTYLGAGADAEFDGQPSADATGDDLNEDDEDGVLFTNRLWRGGTCKLTVIASKPGVLNAWADFNGNGAFDIGEQVFTNKNLQTSGGHQLEFKVPADAAVGMLGVRFRFTAAAGEGGDRPTGLALTGEVEDYAVNIHRFADISPPGIGVPGVNPLGLAVLSLLLAVIGAVNRPRRRRE